MYMSKYYLQEGWEIGVSWTEITATLDEAAAVKLKLDPGDRLGVFVHYRLGYRSFNAPCGIGWRTGLLPGSAVYGNLCNLRYGSDRR